MKLKSTEGIFNDVIEKISEQIARLPEVAKGEEMRWVLTMRVDDGSANILTCGVDETQAIEILRMVANNMAVSEKVPVGGKLQ